MFSHQYHLFRRFLLLCEHRGVFVSYPTEQRQLLHLKYTKTLQFKPFSHQNLRPKAFSHQSLRIEDFSHQSLRIEGVHTRVCGLRRVHTIVCGLRHVHTRVCGLRRVHTRVCGLRRFHTVLCPLHGTKISSRNNEPKPGYVVGMVQSVLPSSFMCVIFRNQCYSGPLAQLVRAPC